jgi:hypothetical protein
MAATGVPHFQEELRALQGRLLEMGGLAEERVRTVIAGLETGEPTLVAHVAGGDKPINELLIDIPASPHPTTDPPRGLPGHNYRDARCPPVCNLSHQSGGPPVAAVLQQALP